MTVFVDTSVWIEFFRGRAGDIVSEVRRLLDDDRVVLAAPVRIELLAGARPAARKALRETLTALPTHRPESGDWDRIEDWAVEGGRAGFTFAIGDLVVGVLADREAGSVWSLDEDFARMAKLGFLRLHRPG